MLRLLQGKWDQGQVHQSKYNWGNWGQQGLQISLTDHLSSYEWLRTKFALYTLKRRKNSMESKKPNSATSSTTFFPARIETPTKYTSKRYHLIRPCSLLAKSSPTFLSGVDCFDDAAQQSRSFALTSRSNLPKDLWKRVKMLCGEEGRRYKSCLG